MAICRTFSLETSCSGTEAIISLLSLSQGAVNIETLRVVESDLLKEQIEEILLLVSADTKLELLEVSFQDAFVICDEVIEKSELKELRVSEDYEYDEENWMQLYFP